MVHEIMLLLADGGLHTLAGVLLAVYCCYLLLTGMKLCRVDAREHRLPRLIVYPLIVSTYLTLSMVLLLKGDAGSVLRLFAGGLLLWLAYALMRIMSLGALGAGDVRLALALGGALAYFSLVNLLWASFITFLVGGVWALLRVLFGGARGSTRMAFGPFMLLGALVGLGWPMVTLSYVF